MRGENLNKGLAVETPRWKRDAMRNHPGERGGRGSGIGGGGATIAYEAAGASRSAIAQAARGNGRPAGRRAAVLGTDIAVGKKSGGKRPRYERELENLLDTSAAGGSERVLRHASESARRLSEGLKGGDIKACPETVGAALRRLGRRRRGGSF